MLQLCPQKKVGTNQNGLGPQILEYSMFPWIGLRENLQENTIFDGKIHGFL